jgi:DNA-binding NtrC family response regulator
MRTAPTLLIADDDADVAVAARLALRRAFAEVVTVATPQQVAAAVERHRPAVLLLDMNFTPGRHDGEEGLALLAQLTARADAPAVVVMTAYADIALAVRALKAGAFDFVPKPWDNAKLVATVSAALAAHAPAATDPTSPLIGDSTAMRELRALIANVAPTDANVLILGDNGVGKELVARALHQASARAAATFLAVDLGAVPENTFESELFGHRKGSFTDARSDRAGRFQAARGGTLFLDEIGNLALALQGKLLTVLERREVTPLGADRPEPVDVRLVSATNLDEAQLFDPARFRADLLYRLNTIVLRVPPLRTRREDIGPLAEHYLRLYAAQYDKPPRPVTSAAFDALQAHAWPGNVRELRHACERAVILAPGSRFEARDFALEPIAATAGPGDDLRLDARERETIVAALRESGGNISHTARRLGVSRAALYRKLAKHGL